jgi:hypothetical protein
LSLPWPNSGIALGSKCRVKTVHVRLEVFSGLARICQKNARGFADSLIHSHSKIENGLGKLYYMMAKNIIGRVAPGYELVRQVDVALVSLRPFGFDFFKVGNKALNVICAEDRFVPCHF